MFDLLFRGHKAHLSGWGRQYLESECGYAWYDKQTNEWLHSPPKAVYGNILSSVELKVLSDDEARKVI